MGQDIPSAAPLIHSLSFVYKGIMPFRYDQLGKSKNSVDGSTSNKYFMVIVQ